MTSKDEHLKAYASGWRQGATDKAPGSNEPAVLRGHQHGMNAFRAALELEREQIGLDAGPHTMNMMRADVERAHIEKIARASADSPIIDPNDDCGYCHHRRKAHLPNGSACTVVLSGQHRCGCDKFLEPVVTSGVIVAVSPEESVTVPTPPAENAPTTLETLFVDFAAIRAQHAVKMGSIPSGCREIKLAEPIVTEHEWSVDLADRFY